MFDQFLMNLKQGKPVVKAVAAPSRAPIDKLAQHQGYPFAGTIEEKLGEAEYWLERITQIVTKQLSYSDEHKLKCAVALLVDEALSWWETTTLTTPTEKVTWEFFVEEFKKKYIREQHFDARKKKFLYLKQGSEPIGQSPSEFRKDDHFIRDYPQNIQKVLAQPSAESSFTPPVRNESSKQAQFENQGRGKGNYSKASTHQKSRAPDRVYHIEGRNNEKSLEVITEGPVRILDREMKRLRNKILPLVKALWKNHGVEEVTWETEAAMQEQYPHLFYSSKNSRTNSLFKGEGIVISSKRPRRIPNYG
ncbi:hypothetical protein GQ457_16G017640 [Hibiscus cannabinus]